MKESSQTNPSETVVTSPTLRSPLGRFLHIGATPNSDKKKSYITRRIDMPDTQERKTSVADSLDHVLSPPTKSLFRRRRGSMGSVTGGAMEFCCLDDDDDDDDNDDNSLSDEDILNGGKSKVTSKKKKKKKKKAAQRTDEFTENSDAAPARIVAKKKKKKTIGDEVFDAEAPQFDLALEISKAPTTFESSFLPVLDRSNTKASKTSNGVESSGISPVELKDKRNTQNDKKLEKTERKSPGKKKETTSLPPKPTRASSITPRMEANLTASISPRKQKRRLSNPGNSSQADAPSSKSIESKKEQLKSPRKRGEDATKTKTIMSSSKMPSEPSLSKVPTTSKIGKQDDTSAKSHRKTRSMSLSCAPSSSEPIAQQEATKGPVSPNDKSVDSFKSAKHQAPKSPRSIDSASKPEKAALIARRKHSKRQQVNRATLNSDKGKAAVAGKIDHVEANDHNPEIGTMSLNDAEDKGTSRKRMSRRARPTGGSSTHSRSRSLPSVGLSRSSSNRSLKSTGESSVPPVRVPTSTSSPKRRSRSLRSSQAPANSSSTTSKTTNPAPTPCQSTSLGGRRQQRSASISSMRSIKNRARSSRRSSMSYGENPLEKLQTGLSGEDSSVDTKETQTTVDSISPSVTEATPAKEDVPQGEHRSSLTYGTSGISARSTIRHNRRGKNQASPPLLEPFVTSDTTTSKAAAKTASDSTDLDSSLVLEDINVKDEVPKLSSLSICMSEASGNTTSYKD